VTSVFRMILIALNRAEIKYINRLFMFLMKDSSQLLSSLPAQSFPDD